MVERKGEWAKEEKKVYLVPIECGNCAHQFNATVPKGTTFEDYRNKGIICPNCQCRALD